MPWSKDNAPNAAKDLPDGALKIFLTVANERKTAGDPDGTAISKGLAAVKTAGWKQGEGGKWMAPVAKKSADDAEALLLTIKDTIAAAEGQALESMHAQFHAWADADELVDGLTAEDMMALHDAVTARLVGSGRSSQLTKIVYGDGAKHIEIPSDADAFSVSIKNYGQAKKKMAVDQMRDNSQSVDRFTGLRQQFKDWGPVMKAVCLIGANAPAVKTLADVQARGAPGELRDVEVFEVGYHNKKWYGLDFLDLVVRNFNALKEVMKPPLWLDHGDDQPILRASGLVDKATGQPAAGWMSDLRRVGSKLVAQFTGVPDLVRQLIESGAYVRISPEIYPVFEFDEAADALHLNAQADNSEGGDDDVTTFTAAEVKAQLEEAIEKATLKFREELAGLKLEAKKNVTERDAALRARDKAEVDKFTEDLRTSGLAPALIDGLGMSEFLLDQDNTEVLKFTEADGSEPATSRKHAMKLIKAFADRGRKNDLFVKKGAVAPAEKFVDGAGGKDGEGDLAKNMAAGTQRGREKDTPAPEL